MVRSSRWECGRTVAEERLQESHSSACSSRASCSLPPDPKSSSTTFASVTPRPRLSSPSFRPPPTSLRSSSCVLAYPAAFALFANSPGSQACVEHRLDSIKLEMKKEFAVTVVLASEGYPGAYKTGVEITVGVLPKGSCRSRPSTGFY